MKVRGVLLLRVEGRRLGVPLAEVLEVGEAPAAMAVPGSHAALRGVVQGRGQLVPLFHLGALLGGRPCPAPRTGATMVLAVAGGRWIGLEVDEADAAPNEEILPHPLGARAEGWTLGALKRPEGWVPILNLGALAERWLPREMPI